MNDNVLDSLSENKGKIFIFAVGFIAFIIVASILSNITQKNNDRKNLEKALKLLGERVYTDVYYNNLKEEPSTYETEGIVITLKDMFNYIDEDVNDYFYNRNTKETCDLNGSYVKIYPINPYGVNDYEIEYNLDCGY